MVNTLLSRFFHAGWFYFCLSVFFFAIFGLRCLVGYMYPMSILKRNPKSSKNLFLVKTFPFSQQSIPFDKKNTTPRSFKPLTSKLRALWHFVSLWNLTVQRSTTAYCNLLEIFAQLSSATRTYNILLTTIYSSFYFMSYWRLSFFSRFSNILWGVGKSTFSLMI